jgi:hypothetical protein
MAPIRMQKLGSVPLDVRALKILFKGNGSPCNPLVEAQPNPYHLLHKSQEFRIRLAQVPVESTDLVVPAVCVIVALLRAPHFIPHQEHGRADRKETQREEVLDLLNA